MRRRAKGAFRIVLLPKVWRFFCETRSGTLKVECHLVNGRIRHQVSNITAYSDFHVNTTRQASGFTRPGAPPFPLPRLHGESYGTRIRRMADLGTKIRGWIQSPEQGRGPLIQARLKDVWTIGHYAVGVPGSPRSPSAKQAPRPFFHPIVAANQSTTDQDAVAKPALMLNINSRTLCSWELPAFGCKLNFRWQRLFVRPVPLTAAPTRCGRRGGRRRGEAPGNR